MWQSASSLPRSLWEHTVQGFQQLSGGIHIRTDKRNSQSSQWKGNSVKCPFTGFGTADFPPTNCACLFYFCLISRWVAFFFFFVSVLLFAFSVFEKHPLQSWRSLKVHLALWNYNFLYLQSQLLLFRSPSFGLHGAAKSVQPGKWKTDVTLPQRLQFLVVTLTLFLAHRSKLYIAVSFRGSLV